MKNNPYDIEKRSLSSIYPSNFFSTIGWMVDRSVPRKDNFGRTAEEVLKDCGYYSDDNFNYLTKLPQEVLPPHIIKENPVIYKFNKDWMRCDNFSSEHNGTHILFAGCSETEGAGGNIEDAWTYKLYQKLSQKNKLSGFYSVARSGAGPYHIIANVNLYIKKFGAPDYLLIMMPNVLRYFEWTEKEKGWISKQSTPGYTRIQDQLVEGHDPKDLIKHTELFPYWVYAWDSFLSFCNAKNIKVIWATWHMQEQGNIYKLMELGAFEGSTFMYYGGIDEEVISKYRPTLELGKHDIFKRDGHQGNIFHEYLTDKFLEEIEKDGKLIV